MRQSAQGLAAGRAFLHRQISRGHGADPDRVPGRGQAL